MGEKELKQALTAYDRFTVFLYRTGIVVATMCILYATGFFYLHVNALVVPPVFSGSNPVMVFWAFVGSVSVSVSFLHLYSKKVLNIIRAFAVFGVLILFFLALTGNLDYRALFESHGWQGKIGVIGLGFVLAGFSGIGAKEAFCFRLYEGYAYGIALAILVLLHLSGFLSPGFGFVYTCLVAVLILVFTIRKLFLPVHYDIGDKSRY